MKRAAIPRQTIQTEDGNGLPRVIRFGAFELDLASKELRKQGFKIKLQEQPFEVLSMLLAHPGEMVTRGELQKKLWPADTFVDFEHGLNKAINKIRDALGDSAPNPRFIETLPRRGYRFISPGNASGKPAVGRPSDVPLAISRRTSRALFMFIQIGYLAMYGVALQHLPGVSHLGFLSGRQTELLVAFYLLCGVALRIYLLAAVAFDYPDAGRMFRKLIPFIVPFDLLWSASPLLLFGLLREVVLLFVAGLAFLPFSQRSLLYSAYGSGGGRTSAPGPLDSA